MSEGISISLCMIVKNEEEMLGKALGSVSSFVDEIIIADTGSIDKTKDIAKEFGAKIYDFKWIDDFSAARNYAFSKATKEYIFWLDADDYLDDENISEMKFLKKNLNKNVDAVTMNYSLNRDKDEKTTFSLRRNRLLKRERNFIWIGKVHEFIDVYGNQYHSDVTVNHGKTKEHSQRNIKIFMNMEKNNEKFTVRDLFYFANELYHNGHYAEAIEKYEKFLNLDSGWVEDKKTATMNIINCYSLENQNDKKIPMILKSFEYDTPRADICCALAETFLEEDKILQAIFWYKVAMGCKHNKNNLGMNPKNYYTWIPSIQLCVCYCRLEDYETAHYYNELTAVYIPESSKVTHNREFIKRKLMGLGKEIPEVEVDLKHIKYSHL